MIQVVVPDALVEELFLLRYGYAKLIYNYEEQLHNSPAWGTREVY